MRDKTADPSFLLQKKIEQKVSKLHPEKWLPLYSMVSFSNIKYSTAWEVGKKQEQIMAKIMKLPQIEKKWDDFYEWLHTCPFKWSQSSHPTSGMTAINFDIEEE